jgi:hypothetical protein
MNPFLTLLFFAHLLGTGLAVARGGNPCAEDIADFCSDMITEELHNCLARKRNHVSQECSEQITHFYERRLGEQMPKPDERRFGAHQEENDARVSHRSPAQSDFRSPVERRVSWDNLNTSKFAWGRE